MEKLKTIFLNLFYKLRSLVKRTRENIKNSILSSASSSTSKKDFNKKRILTFLYIVGAVFIIIMLISPSKEERKFREVIAIDKLLKKDTPTSTNQQLADRQKQNVWGYSGTPRNMHQQQEPNLNSSMLVQPNGGSNSGLQFQQGSRFRVRLAEKLNASISPVPVIATVTEDALTDYGMTVFAGSQLYGEATYSKSSEKAEITFKQLVLTTGEIKPINARAAGFDGKLGLAGNVESNVMQTSFGQVVTSFVGGLAAGTVERDLMGNSKGGITNGLLSAVAETARGKAEKYGESLKEEQIWIEVNEGVEFNAVLEQPLKMIEQDGGNR